MPEPISLIIGLAVTAATIAAQQAAARNMAKSMPTLDTGEGAEADARSLPARRAVEAAAQMGTTVDVATGRMVTVQKPGKMVYVWGQKVPYNPEDFAPGGKYAKVPASKVGQPFYAERPTQEAERISADFTGMGEADIQAKIADQMAGKYLEMGDKYGPEFIAESKRQLELADPEGTAARNKLYDLITSEADRKVERPVAALLEQRVQERLNNGNRLDASTAGVADAATGAANTARGDRLDARMLRKEMETGSAGEARAAGGRQAGLNWLTSGATPEDTEYRRTQQNMANLAAFQRGETPVTQFAQLTGAQQGATPFVPGRGLPQMDNAAEATANDYNLGGWQAQQSARLGQANSWLGMLSGMLSAGSSVVAARQT